LLEARHIQERRQKMAFLFKALLFLTAVFLIVLVLIQRGKGGGLAGAFGGLGGQSAFGTKAGDMFTKVTIGTAAFWIVLCLLSVRLLSPTKGGLNLGAANPGVEQQEGAGAEEGLPASPAGDDTGGGREPTSEGG
jgi:preprotein translocase subunit SecG